MARSMRASWASSRIPPPSNVPGETRGEGTRGEGARRRTDTEENGHGGDGGAGRRGGEGAGGEEEEEEEEEGWSKTPTSLFSRVSLLFSL